MWRLRRATLDQASLGLWDSITILKTSACSAYSIVIHVEVFRYFLLLLSSSVARCTFACGSLGFCTSTHGRTTLQHRFLSSSLFCNYLSGSAFPCQFCLLWTLLQEVYPLKHFWRRNVALLSRTIWSVCTCRTLGLDFFPCRYIIVHLVADPLCTSFRERGEWLNRITHDVGSMDPTIFTSFGTTWSTWFGALRASDSAHNDVYTGGGLLHFSSYATLTSVDIHGWIPSQWYPSRRFFI